MKRKIGIITINDDNNYGNRLQNYAVQKFIVGYNTKVETINNQIGIVGFGKIKKYVKDFIKRIYYFNYRRYNAFMKFNRKYIRYSKFYIDKNNVSKRLNEKYDYFFVGSDQVWNYTFGRMSDIDFLSFVDKNKRNAFSASFGITNIPENMKEYYKEKLNELNNISVREDRGKELIKELTGREDAVVLLDPTMLLDVNEWDKISKKPKKMRKNEKYILNYFLGEMSETRKNEILRIAKENNCKIINILDKNDPYYISGPSEFVYLEKNAFLICTDSFHSTVFAILYKRPFIIFDREDKEVKMNSRIETLLSKFNLQHREFNGRIINELLKNDDICVDDILKIERKKAEKYLQKVFKEDNK